MHSILFFGKDEGRMGSSEPYFLAINENEVLTAPNIDHSIVEKIKYGIINENINENVFQDLLNKIQFFIPNDKVGWDFDMYPIKRLIHSVYPEGTPFDDGICLKYKEEYFKLNTVADAGMGNYGVCIGQFEVLNKI